MKAEERVERILTKGLGLVGPELSALMRAEIRAAERAAAADELASLAVAYGGDSEYRVKIEAGGLLAYLADRIAELRGDHRDK